MENSGDMTSVTKFYNDSQLRICLLCSYTHPMVALKYFVTRIISDFVKIEQERPECLPDAVVLVKSDERFLLVIRLLRDIQRPFDTVMRIVKNANEAFYLAYKDEIMASFLEGIISFNNEILKVLGSLSEIEVRKLSKLNENEVMLQTKIQVFILLGKRRHATKKLLETIVERNPGH
ncbi:uncharacterized protein LOC119687826 [Teleopsis dalmanni]|uniref:uncharacterized protein LOC119687826 n=1 Tax=Teleopsis dalmanni TaxID=139649 RepID=UPI000D329D56|nr:uncharacterized protein LOC119687826 [Teleopsis dalmanni]